MIFWRAILRRGVYSLGDVAPTLSPSMDIQVASNFERYLYYLAWDQAHGHAEPMKATAILKQWMSEFKQTGALKTGVKDHACFAAGRGDTAMTLATIKNYWEAHHYLLDPHTAVGVAVAEGHITAGVPMICLATAHPAKFSEAIMRATGQDLAHHPILDAIMLLPSRVDVVPADKAVIANIISSH